MRYMNHTRARIDECWDVLIALEEPVTTSFALLRDSTKLTPPALCFDISQSRRGPGSMHSAMMHLADRQLGKAVGACFRLNHLSVKRWFGFGCVYYKRRRFSLSYPAALSL